MRLLTKILFLLNIAVWIGSDAICWAHTGSTLGLVVLIGFIFFLIAWIISNEAIAPIDDFMYPVWNLFIRKIKWAYNASLIGMGLFIIICVAFDLLQMREFLNMKST
jgi:hypothetical protein